MIVEPAPAKLNLALHVCARRSDGYHELETLFAFVADGDVVTIEPADVDRFAITGPFADALSGDGDNLVTRARDAFRASVAPAPPLSILLDKHLPVASGIGGGSADAAATLRAMARLVGIAHDDPRLIACAEALGSDVPACLFGRSAIGRGRGEALTPVAGAPGTPVLLVNPGVAVSTAAVFARWSGADGGPLAGGQLIDRAVRSRNDLYPPALTLAPVIGTAVAWLEATGGAALARMSGSGATCFGLFGSTADRDVAAARLAADYPLWWCLKTVLA